MTTRIPAVPSKHNIGNAPRSRYTAVPPTNAAASANLPRGADLFYGQEEIARLSARFITHLFACPELPPVATHQNARLPLFIAYALHRTKLNPCVSIAALVLLQRLKARFPTARGSSGHRLYISAFMIASKVICDDTYSNKSWGIVAQGMFSLREINQMEREMCGYLEWELNVDNTMLKTFESKLRKDFVNPEGPYPTYPLSMVSKRAARAAASTTSTSSSTTSSPVPASPSQKLAPPAPVTVPAPAPIPSHRHESPTTPDTPSPSFSNATSPASSGSPATPVGGDVYNPQVKTFDSPLDFMLSKEELPPIHPLKGQMYAMAVPSTW